MPESTVASAYQITTIRHMPAPMRENTLFTRLSHSS